MDNENMPINEERESYLETIVFGRSSIKKRQKELDTYKGEKKNKKLKNFKPVWKDSDDDEEETEKDSSHISPGLKYNELQQKFIKSHITDNSWAEIKENQEIGEELEFKTKVDDYLLKNVEQDPWALSLDYKLLKYKWIGNLRNCIKDFNRQLPVNEGDDRIIKSKNFSPGGRITSIKFHPYFQTMCSTEINGTFRLFSIQKKACEQILKVDLKKFDISSCEFLTTAHEEIVFVASNSWFLYTFDLRTEKLAKFYWRKKHSAVVPKKIATSFDGKYFVLYGNNSGQIPIFSQNAKEHLNTLYANSNICSATFSLDSKYLMALTIDGEMFVWDIAYMQGGTNPQTSKNVVKFSDRGNYQATAMALAPNGDYLATGSDSGVVNLYDMRSWMKRVALASSGEVTAPPLIKAWKNIGTPVTLLDINPLSDLLIMGSSYKKDCVKIANLHKRSIYTNFPNNRARLSSHQSVYTSGFSPSSGYLALGSDLGNVNLYQLNAYPNY